jgi:iron complex transport system substrate-binding protein
MKFNNSIRLISFLAIILAFGFTTISNNNTVKVLPKTLKIVSLNGVISEIIAEIGLGNNIVATDITSNYPAFIKNKKKVGHNRNLNVEGILALKPDVIMATASSLSPTLTAQFKAAGVKVMLFKQEFSVAGTRNLISAVADSLQQNKKGQLLLKTFDQDALLLKKIVAKKPKPKVLFIYARGTGTMMVAGLDTQVAKIINLAGGTNAVNDFKDFKPLNAEALVAINPDVILLFDSGLQSLGGVNGLLAVQGIAATNAGINKKIITMEGEYLTSFGPRLYKAISQLSVKIK